MRCNGIYEVSSLIFPLQIIVAKELDEEAHIWLKSLTRQITVQRARSLAYHYREAKETGTKRDQQNAEAVVDLVSHASNIEVATSVKEDGIMTIMDVAGPIIEEERKRADAAARRADAAARRADAAVRRADTATVLGIRNMIELCFDLNQPEAVAKAAVIKKYPDTDTEFINSVISEIYGS